MRKPLEYWPLFLFESLAKQCGVDRVHGVNPIIFVNVYAFWLGANLGEFFGGSTGIALQSTME